jgi:hypothetical protein
MDEHDEYIDFEEAYNDLTSDGIKELLTWLEKDGHLTKYRTHDKVSLIEAEFLDALGKLEHNYLNLTKSEEEQIKEIAKRF